MSGPGPNERRRRNLSRLEVAASIIAALSLGIALAFFLHWHD